MPSQEMNCDSTESVARPKNIKFGTRSAAILQPYVAEIALFELISGPSTCPASLACIGPFFLTPPGLYSPCRPARGGYGDKRAS
jgi:hypothetical protein